MAREFRVPLIVLVIVLFYLMLPPTKTIFYRIISETLVLSIKDEEVNGEMLVQYKGEEVKEDIYLVILRLWNASLEPILPDEYKVNPFKLNFGIAAKLLSVQVLESKPSTIKEEINANKLIQFDDGDVVLTPIWLNRDNSFTLKVILTKYQGDVITDETRIIVGGYVRNWNKTIYSRVKKFLDIFLNTIIGILSITIVIIIFTLINNFVTTFSSISKNYYNYYSVVFILIVLVAWYLTYSIMIKYARKWINKMFTQ